jgi:transposase
MCINGIKFGSAWMFVHRFLSDKKFQIDDALWRCHFNIIFSLLREKKFIQPRANIQINVDYTTINRNFLILSASVNIAEGKSVLLYFSMRNYPDGEKKMDQKKMEQAFFKELRHLLPQKYTYTIVGDRGFGNKRIIEICEKCGFDYVFRMNDNLWLKTKEGKVQKLQEYQGENSFFRAKIVRWKKEVNFAVKTKNNTTWYIATNVENPEVSGMYEDRFKIEKLFQDLKSSGFDIEKSKIRKYDRVKRIFYLSSLCHVLMVFLGSFIKYCKKNIRIIGGLFQLV